MLGFTDNACQLVGRRRATQHKLFECVQTFVAMGKAPHAYGLAILIHHLDIVMRVRPIQSDVPHGRASFLQLFPGGVGSLYIGCSKQRPSNHRLAKARLPGKHDLLLPVEPRGEKSLSPAACIEQGRSLLTLLSRVWKNINK
jgi:hypothetical protein